MGNLTEEQRALYLANRGVKCPFCESDDIETGEVSVNDGLSEAIVRCYDCQEEWVDQYKLVNVREA